MSHYLAQPKSKSQGGILVLHAWWGLNDFFKEFCNRLSEEGFTVLAPDLYNGAVATTIPEAKKLRSTSRAAAPQQILQSLKQLQNEMEGQPIAWIGFSMGTYLGLELLQQKPKTFSGAVLFYGTHGGEYPKTTSAFLGHFVESDEYVADSGRKKLEKILKTASPEVSFCVYPNTRHWSFESNRPEYDRQAAELAWARTVEFLKKTLV
jgi:carboxymethylenebutenolidase